MKLKRIYLDYNSTTPLRPEVEAAMQPFWKSTFGNSSSRHQAGQEAWIALEAARERIAELVQADADDVIFTSGATESNFLALLGRFDYLVQEGRRPSHIRVAVGSLEHPCVRNCAEEMKRRGAKVHEIPATSKGVVYPEFITERKPYDIVSVMTANHETGAIQPLKQITERLDPEITFFHTDAAQWAGRTKADFDQWGVSAISLSAHKMYGPKGIGALILRKKWKLVPIFPGSQEGGMRGGTVFVPGAAGFGEAASCIRTNRRNEIDRLHLLRELLWKSLSCSGTRAIRTVSHENCLPNTLHVRFPELKGERVVSALDRLGICCSSGPACSSGSSVASPILTAMGLSEEEAWEGVRFSLGLYTTKEEIDQAGEIIREWLENQTERDA